MIHATCNGLVTGLGDCDEGSVKGRQTPVEGYPDTNKTCSYLIWLRGRLKNYNFSSACADRSLIHIRNKPTIKNV